MSKETKPDWDKITEGKIRHGFAVSAFSSGKSMTNELCEEIECWVRYVVDGKVPSGNKETQPNPKPNPKTMSNVSFTGLLNEVAVKRTDADYISQIIVDASSSLKDSDRKKVLKSLEDGHITKANLDSCLERIDALAKESENAKL